MDGVSGSVKFLKWQINAPAQDDFFQPPADLPRRPAEESYLYSLFTFWLNMALGPS
jgi:hypothetical protein